MSIQSIPEGSTLQAVLSTHVDTSLVVPAAIVQPPSQPNGLEAPAVVQTPAVTFQYTRQVYALLVNGIAGQQDPGGNAVGPAEARIINQGPFYSPDPPASMAAGIPVGGSATNDTMTAAVVASLSNLAGNSTSIFTH